MTSLGEWMEHDHSRLDGLWERAEQAGVRDRAGAASLYHQFADGLIRHIAAEEELLFPFFERYSGPHEPGLIDLLRREHEEIRESLAQLLDAVDLGRTDLGFAATALRNALWAHNAREEGLLYPWFDPAITDGSGRDLATQMRERIDSNTPPL
ncbi:MAG: hemerythrin domain-containing protein [Thermoplasmata archaeon]